MLNEDAEILFSNFTYHPDVYYFLFIGDLKAYGLNSFLQESLARRIPNRDVRFIAVIPDICIQYNYANLFVINPSVREDIVNEESGLVNLNGCRTSRRIEYDQFIRAVSANRTIRALIAQILKRQNHLYISVYENIEELTLDEIKGVSVIGPDKKVARRYNNKLLQYRELHTVLPMPEFRICSDSADLLQTTAALRSTWHDGIFVSKPFSAAGANSAVTRTQEEVERLCSGTGGDGAYLVTRYVPHGYDPTVLGVVANAEDVYVAGVADQVIVGGNRFTGSKFPSILGEGTQRTLCDYTRLVGRHLGKQGYRGIFGCDFLVDDEGSILFLEVNARKQGTTLEFCYTLEQSLPEGSPSLMELEFSAVTEDRFPANARELTTNHRGLHWGTYNFKLDTRKKTTGYIPQNTYEREAFRKVANGELLKDFAILEHVGTNFFVMPGTFLARVVSVARNREDVDEGLCQGVGFIQQTIEEA